MSDRRESRYVSTMGGSPASEFQYGAVFPSKPEICGPGLWLAIHMMAAHIRNNNDKNSFIHFMKTLAEKHPCPKCRKHMTQYLLEYPLENYYHIENGYLIYSVNFHNFVNQRLNKPQMELREAIVMYQGNMDTLCTVDCGSDDELEPMNQNPVELYSFTPLQRTTNSTRSSGSVPRRSYY
jgi:Erv1/Alr family protein